MKDTLAAASSPHRRNYTALFLSAGVLTVYFLIMKGTGNLPRHLFQVEDAVSARNFVNILARASVTLISTILAALFVAIPLTANNYTPQLIDLFVKSWVHRTVLGLYVISAAFAVWLTVLVTDESIPRLHIAVSMVLVLSSLALLLPYLFLILRLLDPDEIIRQVERTVLNAMSTQASPAIAARQQLLARRIGQLGNIVLRSIDRSDRDTALSAIEALERCSITYLNTKSKQPDEWFLVNSDLFPGLSPEAIRAISNERTWVEMDLLRQLTRAFTASLSRMPDVVSAIGRTNRHVAVTASELNDPFILDLAIRYFNNYQREAIKRKDIHALYDTLFQYRQLALKIFALHPVRVLTMARHLEYYAKTAVDAGIPFALDVVAYDLGGILAAAPPNVSFAAHLDVFLRLELQQRQPDSTGLTAGIAKARLILAVHLDQQGRQVECQRIIDSFCASDREVLIRARDELLADIEQCYWEVTDRQQNLDWLDSNQREVLKRLYGTWFDSSRL